MSRSSYHPTDVVPGRGAAAGVGVAALTGLLFADAFVAVPSLFSVFPALLDEAVLVESGVCAVGAGLAAALFVTRRRASGEIRTLRPGATVDPDLLPAQRGGGQNPRA